MRTSEAPAARLGLAALLLFVFEGALAQISTPPRATDEYRNAVGFGVSYGEQIDRDADFWGWTVEYSRYLGKAWTTGLSLNWDEETERFSGRADKTVKTYALIGSISYSLTRSLNLTTGLAKDIANDDNADASMKFTFGDVATGLSLGYTWPVGPRNSLAVSFSYEYNISQNEPSVSADLAVGWSY